MGWKGVDKNMITAAITKNEKYSGDHVLIVPKKEMQELHNILTTFCDEHKKRTNAKKLLKQLEDLEIW
jgi:hypothetical protein